MFNRRDIIYLYDGSFNGLLCAIFECYKKHELPLSINENNHIQQELFCEYNYITTNLNNAEHISNAISDKISTNFLTELYYAYLSDIKDKELICLKYVIAGFRFGASVNERLSISIVTFIHDAKKRVKNEAHQYLGFIRFQELTGDIFYSEINPKCNILPLIANHFKKRFSNMPWLIHDKERSLCLVYNGKSCYITPIESAPMITLSQNESKYANFWKIFYNTIEIKERQNENCRMTHMPKRFWNNLLEMN